MVKSIEPDIVAWSNQQLEGDGLKIAREQGIIDITIDKALNIEPSKHGGTGGGRPDAQMIISNGAYEIPVFIEYKGSKGNLELVPKKEKLVKLKNDDNTYDFKKAIPNYAVNGACYYGSVVLRHTNFHEVLCVGVNGYDDQQSGERKYEIKAYVLTTDSCDTPILIGEFTDMSFLFREHQNDLIKRIEDAQIDPEELHQKAMLDDERLDTVLKELNNHLRNQSKIRAGQRIFVVAACIMAALGVKDKNDTYIVSPLNESDLIGSREEGETDGDKIDRKVKSFLAKKNLPIEKQKQINNALKQVILFSNLSIKDQETNISPLKSAYVEIKQNVIPAYEMAGTLDFTGKLFNVMNEWVEVPDGDANDVVLTPRYVTNMMARITEVDMNSYVWDWALGSGGFLISAMNIMISDARKRENSPERLAKKIVKIKNNQLLGIEKLPDIYILAILNMILMGDGSSNIGNEDSLKDFDGNYIYDKSAGKFPANVFLLNPPYSAEGNGMIFVKSALKKMNSGKAAVIIQDSAGNGKANEINKEILKNNRLKASIKMPSDLFSSGVQTSIYMFEVGKQHQPGDIVRFINFNIDGYKRNYRKKAKHNLIDTVTAKDRYDDLVKTVLNGVSQSKYLNDNEHFVEDTIDPTLVNDWNFEKHQKLELNPNDGDFQSLIKDYTGWSINNIIQSIDDFDFDIDRTNWKFFKAGDIFNINKITGINKASLTDPVGSEIFDYITRTAENRGINTQTGVAKPKVKGKPVKIHHAGCFSLGLLQMTFYYRERDWYAGQFVREIEPKFKINKNIGIFFETVLSKQSAKLLTVIVSDVDEQFKDLNLLLPATSDGKIDFDEIERIVSNARKKLVDIIVNNL